MKPRLPTEVLRELQESGQSPPWKGKLLLRRGRTVYGVAITADGTIERVGGRAIYADSDLGFPLAAIVNMRLD